MEVTSGGIFVIIFVSCILSSAEAVSGFNTKFGNFQVFQKHPALKKCADSILQKNEFVGVRVSELTGECEGLPHSWGLNQTMESGYAYAKKLFVEENFKPPVGLDSFLWKFPGVFSLGARLDLFIPFTENDMFRLVLSKNTHPDDIYYGSRFIMSFLPGRINIEDSIKLDNREIVKNETMLDDAAPYSGSKISFLAQTDNFVMILLEDKELYTLRLSSPTTMLRKIYMRQDQLNKGPLIILGIQFTAEK
ncbi:uncharacterized protein LOC123537206 isoform X2 [Mercenaria mercenaria]|uniref:uncharacterized protein LOC123537206 isoform X2 n=1 Tax=Mercenaria mercenaria TaxID=6596 RepID=UPI00234E8FC7|nr:uncharacterized protein LOC123537206 isoform X2 [Mercenaria mercenaria]